MTGYHRREVTKPVSKALAQSPVVVVTGMRQVGKSTMLLHERAFKGREYMDMDEFAVLEEATRNPESLLDRSTYLTLDEAQRCPELLLEITRRVDKERKPGRFLLSGSANFALLEQVAESLAGRAIYFTLQPMTRREIEGSINREPLIVRMLAGKPPGATKIEPSPVKDDDVLRGGMPAVCLVEDIDRAIWFAGFERTYLERGIRDIARIDNILGLRRLLRLTALRTGQTLNISNLARDAHLSTLTAEKYLGVLEASFIIRLLPPFLGNRASRLIKSPKVYFTDSGIAAHLCGVEKIHEDPMRGALYETYTLQNLVGIVGAHLLSGRVYFWKVQGRHEVDFVIKSGTKTIAIEVKAASRWGPGDLSSLKAFLSATTGCQAAILAYNGDKVVSLGERLWAIPIPLLLS